MPKLRAWWAAELLALLLFASSAAAQDSPTFPAPGPYLLTISVAAAPRAPHDGTARPSATPAAAAATRSMRLLLARSRDSLTVAEGGAIVLRGEMRGAAISLDGSQGSKRLEIRLRVSGGDPLATGTFTASSAAGRTTRGIAQLAPAPAVSLRTATRDGCSGFWECVKTITGVERNGRP